MESGINCTEDGRGNMMGVLNSIQTKDNDNQKETELGNMKQMFGESFLKFSQRVKYVAKEKFPKTSEEFIEIISSDIMIKGCHNQQIKEILEDIDIRTIDHALAVYDMNMGSKSLASKLDNNSNQMEQTLLQIEDSVNKEDQYLCAYGETKEEKGEEDCEEKDDDGERSKENDGGKDVEDGEGEDGDGEGEDGNDCEGNEEDNDENTDNGNDRDNDDKQITIQQLDEAIGYDIVKPNGENIEMTMKKSSTKMENGNTQKQSRCKQQLRSNVWIATKRKFNLLVRNIVAENEKSHRGTFNNENVQTKPQIHDIPQRKTATVTQEYVANFSALVDRLAPTSIYHQNDTLQSKLKSRKYLYWMQHEEILLDSKYKVPSGSDIKYEMRDISKDHGPSKFTHKVDKCTQTEPFISQPQTQSTYHAECHKNGKQCFDFEDHLIELHMDGQSKSTDNKKTDEESSYKSEEVRKETKLPTEQFHTQMQDKHENQLRTDNIGRIETETLIDKVPGNVEIKMGQKVHGKETKKKKMLKCHDVKGRIVINKEEPSRYEKLPNRHWKLVERPRIKRLTQIIKTRLKTRKKASQILSQNLNVSLAGFHH